jgi:hypothetical protein
VDSCSLSDWIQSYRCFMPIQMSLTLANFVNLITCSRLGMVLSALFKPENYDKVPSHIDPFQSERGISNIIRTDHAHQ